MKTSILKRKKSDIIWLRVHFNFDNNLTKISLEGRHFNYFLLIMVNMTCRISRFQNGGSFQLNSLDTICRESSSSYERIKNKQVIVLLFNQKARKRYTLILHEL
jgi:hypothetical protein